MSFDKPTRTALARMVADCRKILVEDLKDQLQRTYGLQPEGAVLPLEDLAHLDDAGREVAWALRQWQEHLAGLASGGPQARRASAFSRMALETAFAVLNRLAALRLAEERGLLMESVRKGLESDGFQLFERVVGSALGSRGAAYRAYLERVGDELAVDLGVLFDRRAPSALLFPGDRSLEEVLSKLDAPEFARLWAEDETIGWIYQYFNPKEERDEMRAASQAPRNSRELAVRNQFFTPRYVVEFLTDNTLGRLWYEMRRGETRLVEDCRYLVRRKRPVFLAKGEEPPAPFVATEEWRFGGTSDEDLWTRPDPDRDDVWYLWRYAGTIEGYKAAPERLGKDCGDLYHERLEAFHTTGRWEGTFEELRMCLFLVYRIWRFDGHDPEGEQLEEVRSLYAELCRRYDLETEAIPFREKKDPRALRVLDPACGSGHFLLYSFDLLETIYEEAWADEAGPAWEGTGRSLRQDYPDLEVLRRAIPGLVLEHNLHGIDIDRRAVQIAALAMWLRAQKSYQDLGLKPAERPAIRRSRFVCAEPMPGEQALLDEFCDSLPYKSLGNAVQQIFEKMKLAGEAGSLLKIEKELERLSRDVRQVLEKQDLQTVGAQSYLFEEMEPRGRQLVLDEIVSSRETRTWEDLETVLLEALRDYSERASGADAYQRRLFANDAAAGFGFLDLMRQRYDVVLMNPPFGAESEPAKEYLENNYPNSHADIFAPFVERAVVNLVPEGKVGVLSTEAGFFRRTLAPWREHVLQEHAGLEVMAHLGDYVLDEAKVRVAAYTLNPGQREGNAVCVAAFDPETRVESLLEALLAVSYACQAPNVFALDRSEFRKLPHGVYGYWCSAELRNAFARLPTLEETCARTRQGLATADDTRFLRLRWEAPPTNFGWGRMWVPFAKGGEYSPFHDDVHLAVRWGSEGRELIAFSASVIRNPDLYGRPGLTYPPRTNKRFAPRALPAGCSFGHKGPALLAPPASLDALLALVNSRCLGYLLSLGTGITGSSSTGLTVNSFEVGIVQRLPVPLDVTSDLDLARLGHRSWEIRAEPDLRDEVTAWFASPFHPFAPAAPRNLARQVVAHRREQEAEYDVAQLDIDARVRRWYRLSDRDWQDVEEQVGPPHHVDVPEPDDPAFLRELAADLVQYLVGCAFGRWDLRRAMEPAPIERGPFDPLPALPPGARQAEAGQDLLDLPPSGLLVDDGGPEGLSPHAWDLVARVREAARVLFGDEAEEVEHELVTLLGAKSLRDWLRRPADFFAWHLKRYSKSRRQAPIYWPLSTESGSYTVWVYYPRLHPDLLFQAVNKLVEPKIDEVKRSLAHLEERLAAASGHEASRLRAAAEDARKFLAELADLRDELLRVAGLPYKPDLNDGVLISASPLHRLFRLPRWRKDLEACWKDLQGAEFDWAHLAMALWPDRVRDACRKDRSLAIAHGLEDLYEGEVPASGSRGRKPKAAAPPELFPPPPPPPPAAPSPKARSTNGELTPYAASLLATLQAAPTPLGRSDLLAATGIPETAWTPSMNLLKERELVEQLGQKRGATYRARGS